MHSTHYLVRVWSIYYRANGQQDETRARPAEYDIAPHFRSKLPKNTDAFGGSPANSSRGWPATIESKTNFFAAIPIGDIAKAECTPLHRGRTTMVWQTRVTRGDGKLCALVTQTQLVLNREK